jgi:hypothetical protein
LFLLAWLAMIAMPSFAAPEGGNGEGLEPGLEPPPLGKDSGGPPPASTPSKQDRSDLLRNVPLGDPAVRAELLNELYGKLRSARNATEAEPITEAIEQTWRRSGSDTVDLLMSRVDTFVLQADLDLAQVLDAVTGLRQSTAKAGTSAARACDAERYRPASPISGALAMEPNNYRRFAILAPCYSRKAISVARSMPIARRSPSIRSWSRRGAPKSSSPTTSKAGTSRSCPSAVTSS